MSELAEIVKQIEELRKSLHKLAAQKGMADPEVLAVSEMLDATLNKYLQFVEKKKNQ